MTTALPNVIGQTIGEAIAGGIFERNSFRDLRALEGFEDADRPTLRAASVMLRDLQREQGLSRSEALAIATNSSEAREALMRASELRVTFSNDAFIEALGSLPQERQGEYINVLVDAHASFLGAFAGSDVGDAFATQYRFEPSMLLPAQDTTPTGAPIFGRSQITNLDTPAGLRHAVESEAWAQHLSLAENAQSVHMNQSLRTITGDMNAPDLRPDVALVTTDGKLFVYEVPSGPQARNHVRYMEERWSPLRGQRYGRVTLSQAFAIGEHIGVRLPPAGRAVLETAFGRVNSRMRTRVARGALNGIFAAGDLLGGYLMMRDMATQDAFARRYGYRSYLQMPENLRRDFSTCTVGVNCVMTEFGWMHDGYQRA